MTAPDSTNAARRAAALSDPLTVSRMYWAMRLAVSFIWLWTAFVSWWVHPHADSIALLQRCGITVHTDLVFAVSCLLDLVLGSASCVLARAWLWWGQFAVVAAYSLVICWYLPEFVLHPFAPITKNVFVLICLALLAVADQRREA